MLGDLGKRGFKLGLGLVVIPLVDVVVGGVAQDGGERVVGVFRVGWSGKASCGLGKVEFGRQILLIVGR